MSDLEVLQSRQKGKVHTWPHTQKNNHVYVSLAQAYGLTSTYVTYSNCRTLSTSILKSLLSLFMVYCSNLYFMFQAAMKKIGLAEKFFYYFGLFLVERDPAGGISSKNWVYLSMISLSQLVNKKINKNMAPGYIIQLLWIILAKVFKNGPSKICGRQPLKNFELIWSA